MKPIKKGMTEAITRDGRKVTQLTWFDVNHPVKIYGVLGGIVHAWYENGNFWNYTESDDDIFAHVEYEWQWLVRHKEGNFETTSFYRSEDDVKNFGGFVSVNDWTIVSRIEESKREVLTD